MPAGDADVRLRTVARLSAACGAEIAARDPAAEIPWPGIPTVLAMAAHLGVVHRWVAEILRTRRVADEQEAPVLTPRGAGAWFEEGRAALLDALAAVPPETPCWVIGGRPGTAAFWRRRMVFEHVKHLTDLRASGGGTWQTAPELTAEGYADGIDELLTEFLPRSRPTLAPLPGAVVLRATDIDRSWRIDPDWTIDGRADVDDEQAEVVASTGDLALLLWERADPLAGGSRFRIEGPRSAIAALQAASIHPW